MQDQHIASAFDRDLEAIQAQIMKMGGMVEAAILDAAKSLETRDLELAEQGKTIIVISSELPEIMRLSHRIAVMCEGRLTGILPGGKDTTQEDIMHLATQRAAAAPRSASVIPRALRISRIRLIIGAPPFSKLTKLAIFTFLHHRARCKPL